MAENKPTSSSNTSDRSSRFVLIVDDDDKNLSYTSMLVKRLGYHILKAATGEQALATAAGLVPSLIIISVDLAGLSGFKLMRQLKNSSATSHIPFVGLISRDNRDLKDRCFEHGAAGYLCRPIEADMLYRTVQAAIEKNPRTSVRVRAVLPVKVYGNANDSLYGAYTLALSTGGMFLRTMNPVSVNSEISLEFDLNGRAIAAETVVLYNCQAGGGSCRESGIGLRFVDISPKDREIIREFIRNEVLKDISCGS